MARSIEHGPVVLEITQEKEAAEEEGEWTSIRRAHRRRHGEIRVDILSMENAYTFANQKDKGFFQEPRELTPENARQMMVAVDLGLRTGLALYSDDGRLLEYEHAVYETAEDLEAKCLKLMSEWEAKYQRPNNNENIEDDKASFHITHVAVEGADVALRAVWKSMAEDHLHCRLLLVKPEEWRADLLLAKEKASGEAAKEASRLIARQIVADYGGRLHEGKLATDVAEAVLLGYHVSRRLGWIPRKEPCVRRYSNGNIVIPKTIEKSKLLPIVVEPAVLLANASEVKERRRLSSAAEDHGKRHSTTTSYQTSFVRRTT